MNLITLILIIAFLLGFTSSRLFGANAENPERTRYDLLQNEINQYNHFYYQADRSPISDAAYDALTKELYRLEAEHPDWVLSNSPSQKVGSELRADRAQATHLFAMLSMDNTHELKDLKRFMETIAETHPSFTLHLEDKIDGIACSLQYQNGILNRALTRGNGRTGNDITHLVTHLLSVPQILKEKVARILEIRGEIFISKKDSILLNQTRSHKYANARNAAGGILNTKQPDPQNLAFLSFIPHSIGFSTTPIANTQAELIQKFHTLGFPLMLKAKTCSSFKEVESAVSDFKKSKDTRDYEMDGVVLKVNELELLQALGNTSKHWRGMFAYKFASACAWSTIQNIQLQIGGKGKITPVALFNPVILEGSKIQKVSLHNLDEMEKKDIRIGDSLLIEKRGRAIPQVVSALPGKKRGEKIQIINCPFCRTKLKKSFCPNPNCPGRTAKKYFRMQHDPEDRQPYAEAAIN